jgi:O-antigen/teichoic acid export membrane protein
VELTRLVVLLGVAGLVPAVAYNRHFLGRWMGPGFDGGATIAAVAAFNVVLLTLIGMYSIPFATTGRVSLVVRPAAASAVLNLIASVACSKLFGPIGPLLGTSLSALSVGGWYLPWLLRREFGTSLPSLLKAVLSPLPLGAVYAGLVCWAARSHTPPGWLALLAEIGACAAAFLAMGWFAVLGPEDRLLWRARLISPLRGWFGRRLGRGPS